MAAYEQRGDKWRAKVRKAGASKTETFKRKSDAVAWATKREADIEAGKVGLIPNKSFAELPKRYADEVSINKRGARWEQMRIAMFIREYTQLCETRLPDLGPETFAAAPAIGQPSRRSSTWMRRAP
ncbi:hypothetical protein [Chromobacterium sphagni]|uniref:Core-binding (CB) domain-containing protein n=1 Tax=Chromobacterium sphagni TaxID=1903179 RepID=A0ABX3CBR1_9NEIS|nr:hypothetical protein [Chromobacterium sphagni]OHX19732.1 hypothetical protein BI344_08870 [Chromobacterium sphagni]